MLWRSTDDKLHMIYHYILMIPQYHVSWRKLTENHKLFSGALSTAMSWLKSEAYPNISHIESMSDIGSNFHTTSNHRKYPIYSQTVAKIFHLPFNNESRGTCMAVDPSNMQDEDCLAIGAAGSLPNLLLHMLNADGY